MVIANKNIIKIHILDTDAKPVLGSDVAVNCGTQVKFDPINAEWIDDRICQECRRIHVQNNRSEKTFALVEYA